MLHKNRGGFTLVELLVVVVVIGMLTAILVPAVNSARETARQAKCMNHVREFALAMVNYSVATDHYPGHTNPGGHGWVVVILDELGNKDLWEQCRGGTKPAVKLVPAVCPNDDAYDDDTNPDALSYAVNANVCVDRSGGGPGVLATDVKNTTKTVLLGEAPAIGKWHDAGKTFTWDTNNKVQDCLTSEHPNIVIVGFCDGHAKKLSKTLDCSEYFGNPDGSLTPVP